MLSNDVLTLGGFKGWRCDRCGWLMTAIHEGWVAISSPVGHRGDSKTQHRIFCVPLDSISSALKLMAWLAAVRNFRFHLLNVSRTQWD
jgi:hypothetical protein